MDLKFRKQSTQLIFTCFGTLLLAQKAVAFKATLVFVALIISLFVASYQAYAYSWSGCKWPTNNPVYDGHALTSEWNNAVSNGRNQWNNVTPSSLTILRNDTSNNDVTVGVTGGLAGLTLRTCSSGTITDADIVFNKDFTWYKGTGSPGSDWDAWSVAAHEFGHHIGFSHTQYQELCLGSESTRPTMCNGYSPGKTYGRSLEYDDRTGLNVIYP